MELEAYNEQEMDFFFGPEPPQNVSYNAVPPSTMQQIKTEHMLLVERNDTYVDMPMLGIHITTQEIELRKQAARVENFKKLRGVFEFCHEVHPWLHNTVGPLLFHKMQRNLVNHPTVKCTSVPVEYFKYILDKSMPNATRLYTRQTFSQGARLPKQLFTAKYSTTQDLPIPEANWFRTLYLDANSNEIFLAEISSADFTYDFFDSSLTIAFKYRTWHNIPPEVITNVRSHFQLVR